MALKTVPKARPNILVIWGDDIGVHNISAYNHGIMGYRTPNIDRLAREGALFTDAYGEQSCTAGRAAFILGQHPFRTGLLTIGMPGSPHGIMDWMPTIADLLKPLGYTTGQFGKNHLGDRDEHLPASGLSRRSRPSRSFGAADQPANTDRRRPRVGVSGTAALPCGSSPRRSCGRSRRGPGCACAGSG